MLNKIHFISTKICAFLKQFGKGGFIFGSITRQLFKLLILL